MKIIRQLAQLPESLRQGAVSVGNFDGVHKGHAQIVSRLVDHARREGGPAVVFTFDPHPVSLLRPDRVPARLTTTPRKAQLLAKLGVDALVAYPTTKELLSLSPVEFFQQIVVEQLQAKAMVEGPNFFFGKDRAGNVETLAMLAAREGIAVEIVHPVQLAGQQVSSSVVRQLLSDGKVEQASELLTAPYQLTGIVERGAGRGTNLGFATANLGSIETMTPALGVYAGVGHWQDRQFPAAINVGPNPTFGESQNKVEVHLVGLDQPLYGETLEVDFLRRLRDIQPFASVAELQAQLRQDIAQTEQVFAEQPRRST